MKKYVILLLLVILLTACFSKIDKTEAEAIAWNFVSQNVKFYTKSNETINMNITDEVRRINSIEKEGDLWKISMYVSAKVNGEQKDSTINLSIDANSGKVAEFNGKKIGYSQ
jgi:hypothetical protein